MPRYVRHNFSKHHSSSNCGLEFVDFYSDGYTRFKWSWEKIADILGKHGNLNSLVAFSGNSQQKSNYGPHGFAAWLAKQGENVHSSSWVHNYNSGYKIKSHFWAPSLKARQEIAAAQVKMKTAAELYHGDFY